MSFWWKLAFILTPSLSFGIGFSLGTTMTTVWAGPERWENWLDVVAIITRGENRGAMDIVFGVFVKSLGWGFGLASVSTTILTILYCTKKPWKANDKH